MGIGHLSTPETGTDPSAFVLIDAGLSDYDAVYATQLELVEKKRQERVSYDYLIFVEHPDVYTYGRKSKEPPPADLSNTHVIERGGEVTFHNPGQLVGYPILTLKEGERDIHAYLRRLETVIVQVLREFGLEGEHRSGLTGVWLVGKDKKIASVGVAVSSWVTYHGVALNVCNDLRGFSRIRPCGLSSEVMTSMQRELGDACPSLQEVKDAFLRHFSRQFGRFLMV